MEEKCGVSGFGQPDFTVQTRDATVVQDNLLVLENLLAANDADTVAALIAILVEGGQTPAQAAANALTFVSKLGAGDSTILTTLNPAQLDRLSAQAKLRGVFPSEPYAFDTLYLNDPIRDTLVHYGTAPASLLQAQVTLAIARGVVDTSFAQKNISSNPSPPPGKG